MNHMFIYNSTPLDVIQRFVRSLQLQLLAVDLRFITSRAFHMSHFQCKFDCKHGIDTYYIVLRMTLCRSTRVLLTY